MANKSLSQMSLEELEALQSSLSSGSKINFKSPQVANEFSGVSQRLKNVVSNAPDNLTITSGMRTPETNAAVGGVPSSYHLKGEAVDLRKPPGGIDTSYFQKQGYQALDEGDHIHLEPGPGFPKSKSLQEMSDEELQNLFASTLGQSQGAQAGFPVPSDVQYDVRTRQPVVTGGQVEPTLGGLVPGITYEQAKEALPAVLASEASVFAPMIAPALSTGTNVAKIIQSLISPSGAAVGKSLGNVEDVLSGEQSPTQGLISEPLKEGGKFLAAELLGRGLLAAPTAYNRFLSGEGGLLGKTPVIGRFFQPDPIKQKIAEQTARAGVEAIPQKLGIGYPKDIKQVVGDKLRNVISAPEIGSSAKVSKAFESAKNPVLLKYGKKEVPDEYVESIIKTIDDKISKETNNNALQALRSLKEDLIPTTVTPKQAAGFRTSGEVEVIEPKKVTLNNLNFLKDKVKNILSSGGEEAGAIGKIKEPIEESIEKSISRIASPKEATAYMQASKKYKESKDILSNFESKFSKRVQGFNRPKQGESIFQGVANDIFKNPSLIESSIAKHPELKEPLADVIMTDISNRVGAGADINKVVKSYNLDRLKSVLPNHYYSTLTTGIENLNKLNPINKRQAQSKLLIDTILGRNKRGQTATYIGRAKAGLNFDDQQ